jgi:hypothetical protein
MIVDEHIARWEQPSSYAGHNPVGDYIVYAQHRDSGSVDRSNYARILEDVVTKAIEHGQRPGIEKDPIAGETQWVYTFRASHWAVGWVEYIILKQVCPDELVTLVGEIRANLADYPVYDEDHLSTLEFNEATEYWAELDVKERLAVIKDSGARISRFAARRSELPDNDQIFEWVRSN